MKKIIAIVCAFMLAMSGCRANQSNLSFTAGTYTGVAQGRNGEITVDVTLTSDKIKSVSVVSHEETAGIADGAIEKIPQAIVSSQSLNVDVVSGATMTSEAIIEAAKNALDSAGVDVTKLMDKAVAQEKEHVTLDTDVVIVGAGGAGLVAAISAKDAGKDVVVLEKKAIAGGNSTLSTGGMNAAKTSYQDKNEFNEGDAVASRIKSAKEQYPELAELIEVVDKQYQDYLKNPEGYFDSKELFMLDTLVGGKNLNSHELVQALTYQSAEAIEWLDSIGASLSEVGAFGGASVKRIHKPVNAEGKTLAVGSYLIPILEKVAKDKGVQIYYEAPVTSIIQKDNVVVGVEAEGYTVNAKSVVITTGGFAGNSEMVESYKPSLKGFASTNTSGITGDGIVMAEKVGANLVDMDQIQIHPTVEYNAKALITEGLRGDGAILVNNLGQRFTNEVSTRDAVSAAEIEQPDSYAFLIIDQAMVDKSSVIAGYIKAGYTVQGETAEALAEAIIANGDKMNAENLEKTLTEWNEMVANKKDTQFERQTFAQPLDTAPYYAIKVSPGVHHTMGGIQINEFAQVLDKEGNVIDNLFAAGEVTGGVHGANRLGGNAVADIVVFGRIAGNSAANNVK